MAKVTVRKETGKLVIDFTYRGVRCREQTALPDSPPNRKRVQVLIDKIKRAQQDGSFNYGDYFPGSALSMRFDSAVVQVLLEAPETKDADVGPLFNEFATKWVDDHSIEWRRSHIKSLLSTLNGRLIPEFGGKAVGSITKSDILAFRATLAKVKGRGEQVGLSSKRINEIIGLLRQILTEAADQFQFTSPALSIKKLRVRKTDVNPFSLVDVQRVMATARPDYKDYFITRFLTGMRTGEVHGLKWKYIDWDLRIIRVRETFVLGEDEYTKTDGSQRDIQMSQPVFEALKRQFEVTGKASDYVFCNQTGQPLDNKNFSDRVWYPLLRHLDLEKRRPYQMRHTAATLWLASGEAPEWIARQLGHTSTEMLFRVYSRYVPNLTRQDGSAMERLLASQLSQGPLIQQTPPGSNVSVYVPAQDVAPQRMPKPRGVHGATPAQHVGHGSELTTPVRPAGCVDDSANGASLAQPPPLTWLGMADVWMNAHPAAQLN